MQEVEINIECTAHLFVCLFLFCISIAHNQNVFIWIFTYRICKENGVWKWYPGGSTLLGYHVQQAHELFIFCQQSHKRSDSTYIFVFVIKFSTNILALFLICPTCVKLPSVIFISVIKIFYWKMDSPSLHNVNNRKVMPQYDHLVWQSFPQVNEKCQGPFLFVHISVYC